MTEPLQTIELETRPKPSHTVIWLHGLGADGSDFVPVVRELALPPLGIRFIFPHAPMRPVTINGGFVMRAWYDIVSTEIAGAEDEHGIRQSQAAIEALIEKEIGRGIPAGRIVLAGFSQGGAIALQTGLRHPKRLAGLMSLSAYLPLAATLEKERSSVNADCPIFMGHGVVDDIVKFPLGTGTRDRLEGLGYKVEWHKYPMPHSVCPEELGDVGEWIKRVMM